MTPDDLIDRLINLVHGDNPDAAQWWHRAALCAAEQRHVHWIMSRDGADLYLARFWLTPPRLLPGVDHESPFDSGDSVLLHCFARGDDDGSLHDHPWECFTTDLLSGGYTERRPQPFWRDKKQTLARTWPDIGGCRLEDCETLVRRPGDPRQRRWCTDQHALEDVLPDTWTIDFTGPRVSSWGFHPPGRSWMPWRDFIAQKRATVAVPAVQS